MLTTSFHLPSQAMAAAGIAEENSWGFDLVNLIDNGDFASVGPATDLDPTGWIITESSPTSVQVVGGQLHFNSGNGALDGVAEQSVTGVPIGETVNFSFDYLEPGVGAGARHIHVTVTDGNGNIILDQEIDDAAHYDFSFTATSNDYTVTFADTSNGNPENDPILDNVIFDVPFVVCFARDSLILCKRGYIQVQDIRVGDLVQTRDNGMQKVRWVAATIVDGTGRFAPIRFLAGAAGNERDLLVSPHHRMLVSGWRSELLFGEIEVLVAARDLVNDTNIRRDPTQKVGYHHILFDQHQIVNANGAWSESFYPGSFAIRALEQERRGELFDLFPSLRQNQRNYGQTARTSLRPMEARLASQA